MKKLLLAMALVIAFGVVMTVNATAKTDARPFKGTLSGGFVGGPPPAGFTGELIATHMGKGTLYGTLPGAPVPIGPTDGCPFLLRMPADADVVFTAANGDELHIVNREIWEGEFAWTMCPGPDDAMTGNAVYEVVGGTGRFTGATGVIHNTFGIVMADGVPVAHTGELEGWIGY